MRQLRRLLCFAASRIFRGLLWLILLVLAFYTALNTAHLWILVDDGLEARAQTIISGTDDTNLLKYFTQDYLNQDTVLLIGNSNASPYRDYSIRSFKHKTHINAIWAWPWENVATADVIEEVSAIDGALLPEKRENLPKESVDTTLHPPAWNPCRYRVAFIRIAGRWRISSLQYLALER